MVKGSHTATSGSRKFVVELEDGVAIETGMVGRDREFGAAQALVRVPGIASILTADRLKTLANALPDFLALLIKYELFFAAQAQQTSACNAVHDVHKRMCKWLLRMHELVGDRLPLTRDFLAQMMDVQHTSVSGVAVALQKAGMISYSRGHIQILDVDRVKEGACECHEALASHYEKIFGAGSTNARNRSSAHAREYSYEVVTSWLDGPQRQRSISCFVEN
jgi:Mn-dependent DtxR family transcriptional regulator